ncbi:MAG TPA: serine/threonine-protein kinase [Polyangiaceae bacterium]|nr:serine/threonine-protein kinase [Polyangiaceae bacterium]
MLSTGDIIDGKYRIVRLIGEGGMGAVYEGENTRIHRRVAIKVLHAGVAEQAEAVARFEREAQAAGRIGSDHIVEVLDLGALPGGDRYLVMEFLDGDGLGARIKARGRLTPSELHPIAHQLMEGLAAAHGAGIIHRDLKPDNVFLLRSRAGQTDFVKLLDFGISKFNQLSGDSGFSMTRTGAVMGTPYYMAPEQAKGSREMDHRVDLYAAGVILYEALTGQVPFSADTFNELLFKIVLEEPKPLAVVDPTIDPGFAAIVTKAMARDPGHRFQNAREFQQALAQWAAGQGPMLTHALRVPAAPVLASSTLRQPAAPMLGTGTPGAWSQTGPTLDAPPLSIPKKSNAPLFVALGAGALLLLAGGGFAAMSVLRDKKAPVADAAAADASARAAAEQAEHDRIAKLEADKAAAEAQAKQAEADKAAAEAETKRAEAQVTVTPSATVAAVASVAPRPVAPHAAAPQAPRPSSGVSGGRKIRTSL